jgi:hypothetical protein
VHDAGSSHDSGHSCGGGGGGCSSAAASVGPGQQQQQLCCSSDSSSSRDVCSGSTGPAAGCAEAQDYAAEPTQEQQQQQQQQQQQKQQLAGLPLDDSKLKQAHAAFNGKQHQSSSSSRPLANGSSVKHSGRSSSSGSRGSWGVLVLLALVLLMGAASVAGMWVLLLLVGQSAARLGVFVGQAPATPEGPLPECTLKWA